MRNALLITGGVLAFLAVVAPGWIGFAISSAKVNLVYVAMAREVRPGQAPNTEGRVESLAHTLDMSDDQSMWDVQVCLAQVRLLYLLGWDESVVDRADKCGQAGVNHPMLRYFSASAHQNLGEIGPAIGEWKAIGAARSISSIASAADAAGRWEDALLAYSALVAMRPEDANWHNQLAMGLYWHRHDIAGAQAELSRALEIAPHDMWGYVNLGSIAREEGDLPGAIRWFEEAREVNRESEVPLSELGKTYLRTREHAAAALMNDARKGIEQK